MDIQTAESSQKVRLYDITDFYVGVCLAVSSSVFIGASFIIKKVSLNRLSHGGGLRAGQGGFGYLKDWMWWLGLMSMTVGELANFAAYAFAPASLVTPLGALSVIVSAVLASRYLKENINLLGKLGCVLCILGSTVIVIHSPKEEEVETLNELIDKLQDSTFINYVFFVVIGSLAIAFYFGPKYGSQNVVVYIVLCSAVGSLTVMSCKGLGLALKETLSGSSNNFSSWLMYFFFLTVIVCVFVQMNYLNKALDMFNTSIVTPVYYVIFTTLVIIASSILFKEWKRLRSEDVLGNLCGFFVVIIAIFLLHAFKDMDISLEHVRGMLKPKHEMATRLTNNYDYGSNHCLSRSV